MSYGRGCTTKVGSIHKIFHDWPRSIIDQDYLERHQQNQFTITWPLPRSSNWITGSSTGEPSHIHMYFYFFLSFFFPQGIPCCDSHTCRCNVFGGNCKVFYHAIEKDKPSNRKPSSVRVLVSLVAKQIWCWPLLLLFSPWIISGGIDIYFVCSTYFWHILTNINNHEILKRTLNDEWDHPYQPDHKQMWKFWSNFLLYKIVK